MVLQSSLNRLRSPMPCCGVGDCAAQKDGGMPLCAASLRGHVECVKLLLDRGAEVDLPGVSRSLLDRGVRVDEPSMSWWSPVGWAGAGGGGAGVMSWRHQSVMLSPLNLNISGARRPCCWGAPSLVFRVTVQLAGRTPLSTASVYGHVACAQLLLDRGASLDVVDVSWLPAACCDRAWAGLEPCVAA
jgi:hypothetical protein